ncbi:MAG: amino acid adenylation domain-containing protein [Caldilineaceae bacterium]
MTNRDPGTADFLHTLRKRQIRLWVEGDDLCLDAPQGALTAELRTEIKARKPELLAFLQQVAAAPKRTTIQPADQGDALPLSFAQQRLWFLDQMEGPNATYNMPAALHLRGQLDAPALERAVNEIVQRHAILRTTFLARQGQPLQQIATTLQIPLIQHDLRQLSLAEQRETVQRLSAEDAAKPFDLAHGPLLRWTVVQVTPGALKTDEPATSDAAEYVLLVNMHHIISDGWSTAIFVQELTTLYTAFVAGQPSPLPPLAIQYADFAHWQRQWLTGAVLERQLAYWRTQLAGALPLLELPTDRPRPPVQRLDGASECFTLTPALSAQLVQLSQQAGMSLFIPLYSAFFILLHRYSRQDDIVVGTPIANRNRQELEPLIGFFVNTLAIRAQLGGNPTGRELLAQIHQRTLDAYAHQDIPFEQLVEVLQPERTLSYTPLFQTVFAWDNQPQQPLTLPGLTLTPLASDLEGNNHTAKFDLTLAMQPTAAGANEPGSISGRLEYNRALFDAATMRRVIAHYTRILEELVRNPDQRIDNPPLLSGTERHQSLVTWNATHTPYPRAKSVHQLFAEQAACTPEAVAILLADLRAEDAHAITNHQSPITNHLTYKELNTRANQLAHYLRGAGVQPGDLVAICAERSLELIVGLLGILKAGGVYLPLEPNYPAERLAFMLADANVAVILTQAALKAQFAEQAATILCLDADWPHIAQASHADPPCAVGAEDLAYVCYTSGSTGRPKGVCVPHRAVVRLVQETNYVTLNADEKLLQFAPVPFDASTFEIWGALLNGARLVIFPPHLPSLAELGQVLTRYQVTTLWLTAGLFHQMVDENIDGLRTVRQMLAGGDVLSVAHVQKLLRAHQQCRVINGYGPTENTTFTCCHPMTDPDAIGPTAPIGRPIANTQVYILDQQRNPVPIGVPGELYIGGDGLAHGYLNRPELTAERYIPNPFLAEVPPAAQSARLYRTGDLVRYLPNGAIEFLGRIDTQVKVRGFRIELGEIETVLATHPAVVQTVVIVREDRPNDKRIVAYVVLDPLRPTASAALAAYLQAKLPNYMVPSAFVILAALPLDPNGKIDRRALPAPTAITGESQLALPVTATEQALAAIWCDVLNLTQVGIHDNFFALGGHSLLAVQLVAHMEQALGVRLSIADLFQRGSIAELATLLTQEQRRDEPVLLVPIQPHGNKPPLFCVPGGVGIVSYLAPLARSLGTDQPFYALQARGLDGHTPPHTAIEEMAAAYVAAIRQVQPQGPYLLGGHSLGGKIAFAMAQELQRQGETVALVAILDTDAPAPMAVVSPIRQDDNEWLLFFVESIEALVGQQLALAPPQLQGLPLDEQITLVYEQLTALAWLPVASLDELRGMFAVFRAAFQMHYAPTNITPTPIALFRAEPDAAWDVESMARLRERQQRLMGGSNKMAAQQRDSEESWGWSTFAAGPVMVQQTPGNHISMLTEPHVHGLAAKLQQMLEQAMTQHA